MVFTRHLYYVDWAQYGCDIMYFNLVRTFIICRYYDKWRNGLFGKGLSLIYIMGHELLHVSATKMSSLWSTTSRRNFLSHQAPCLKEEYWEKLFHFTAIFFLMWLSISERKLHNNRVSFWRCEIRLRDSFHVITSTGETSNCFTRILQHWRWVDNIYEISRHGLWAE